MTESQQQPSRRRQKQSVWFVRYGLTEHPLLEDLGPYDSDIDPGEGIEHAMSIARRIAAGISDSNNDATNDSIPAVVYASPFLRTAHTGYIVANELQTNNNNQTNQYEDRQQEVVELRLEEGLWEWLIPSLLVTKADGIKTNPRPIPVLKEDLVALEANANRSHTSTIAVGYQSVNPYNDQGDADAGMVCVPPRENNGTTPHPSNSNSNSSGGTPPTWIESEEDLLARCETTLTRLLDLHQTDAKSFCVVSHAPCDQAMAFCLEQRSVASLSNNGDGDGDAAPIKIIGPKDSNLTPWPLGGITVFRRPIMYGDESDSNEIQGYGDWTMELYGDTDHMPGAYKSGLKEWSLPCFSK